MIARIKKMYSNLSALFQYPDMRIKLAKKRELYFFCHAWSFGGAERVHVDILNLFKDQNPICIITDRSKNEGFRKEFEAAADVINMGRWAEKKAYKEHMQKKIAETINNQKAPVVFGNNSPFMYKLIPLLAPHVKIIDLMHNFSDLQEGAEWYSLPYISRLDKRIVVGSQIVGQFRELYKTNDIPEEYLKRITVIRNKITVNDTLPYKDYDDILQVVFVARNSPEKRTDVIIKIAGLCLQKSLKVEFKMIGNFNNYRDLVPPNVQIIGEVHDKETLNTYYKKAHLLLLSSYREGLPLVILEAMSFGAVPVSTNVGDLSSFISEENSNGVLVENLENEDDLAALFFLEIERMYQDRDKLIEFSKNAFQTVKQKFNGDEFSQSYKQTILEK